LITNKISFFVGPQAYLALFQFLPIRNDRNLRRRICKLDCYLSKLLSRRELWWRDESHSRWSPDCLETERSGTF